MYLIQKVRFELLELHAGGQSLKGHQGFSCNQKGKTMLNDLVAGILNFVNGGWGFGVFTERKIGGDIFRARISQAQLRGEGERREGKGEDGDRRFFFAVLREMQPKKNGSKSGEE